MKAPPRGCDNPHHRHQTANRHAYPSHGDRALRYRGSVVR